MFLNRERELASLEESYSSDRAELYVLYGRRRVGKTELLRAFCEGKPSLFFVADLGTETNALADFTRRVSALVLGKPDAISPFATWSAAFEFLADHSLSRRVIVVLDEFTYLVQSNPALPSILQRLWDQTLQHTKIMLVLCGSYVGMMEREVLAYRAPLYGRRTAQWQLLPFDFADSRHFFPRLPPADQVRAYGALGGVPAYLRQIDDGRPLAENIERRILSAGTFLYDEPRFLLLQELHDPSRYFAILEAIAGGRTRANDIAQTAGLPVASLQFYLTTLRELGLVERIVPATERHPEKSRRGIYRILDNYFRFWFHFVHPNRATLELGHVGQVRELVARQLDEFTGSPFESVCQQYLWKLAVTGALGFVPRTVGRWWDDQDEIDVVAVGENDLLVGECKWSINPVGTNVLDDLKRKAIKLTTKTGLASISCVLFARAGFTPDLRARAETEGVRLVDLGGLMA